MPFTVSHAVVALAARRTLLPVAAVAVGSMAPRAVLFAPFLPRYERTPTPGGGIPTIDLAVSLVVLAAWWFLVRPAWAPVVPRTATTAAVRMGSSTRPHRADALARHVVVVRARQRDARRVGRLHAPARPFVVLAWPGAPRHHRRRTTRALLPPDVSSVLGLLALLVVAAVCGDGPTSGSAGAPASVERLVPVAGPDPGRRAGAGRRHAALLGGAGGIGGTPSPHSRSGCRHSWGRYWSSAASRCLVARARHGSPQALTAAAAHPARMRATARSHAASRSASSPEHRLQRRPSKSATSCSAACLGVRHPAAHGRR